MNLNDMTNKLNALIGTNISVLPDCEDNKESVYQSLATIREIIHFRLNDEGQDAPNREENIWIVEILDTVLMDLEFNLIKDWN